jgi:hypothetical protein
MAEEVPVLGRVSDDTYLELIKAMQYVRYNGNSLEALCKFCSILCKDYLFITQVGWSEGRNFGYLHFGIDEDFEATDKLMRVEVFKMIAKTKFKQYYFIEDIINVERDSSGKVINITVVD